MVPTAYHTDCNRNSVEETAHHRNKLHNSHSERDRGRSRVWTRKDERLTLFSLHKTTRCELCLGESYQNCQMRTRDFESSQKAGHRWPYSIRSFAFAASTVCHCILEGVSLPPCFNA